MKYGLRTVLSMLSIMVWWNSYGQMRDVTLTGLIVIESGETFNYKLVFTDSANVLNGYSVTYQQEANDTKAKITGTIDRQRRLLTFNETSVIYTHGLNTDAFMCLVNAKLKYNPDEKGHMLSGSLTSSDFADAACAGGKIIFTNDDAIKKLFEGSNEQFDTVVAFGKQVKKTVATPPQPAVSEPAEPLTLKTEKVTKGIEKTYEWHSDTVTIDFWDGGVNVDGDKITVLLNDDPVLTNYTLQRAKKQIKVPITQALNVITIKALNQGSEPPNTANLLLTDGKKQYSVLAYNEEGQSAIIKIKRVK